MVGSQALDGTSSDDIILNDEQTVKNNISNDSENYSSDTEKGQMSSGSPLQKARENLNKYELGEMTREEYAPYRVTINVKEKSDGEYVYSFSAEKQREFDTPRTLHAVVNDGNNPDANVKLSDNKVTQIEPIVNKNISEQGEDYSIPAISNSEELLEAYENGEISRKEYLDAIKKEKTLSPKEIADLTEEDANTTPKLKKQEGNPQEVPPGRNIPTLQANCFQTIKYHKKKFMSRIKLKIDNILPHAKALQKLLVNL